MEKLDNNHWKCLWSDITFQVINATKALYHVLGIRGMNIKIFFPEIDKHHLSTYKYLQKYKSAKKTVISDLTYMENSSISHLRDKSSEVSDNNIHSNSKSRSLLNLNDT